MESEGSDPERAACLADAKLSTSSGQNPFLSAQNMLIDASIYNQLKEKISMTKCGN
jgi:hypothetical protein